MKKFTAIMLAVLMVASLCTVFSFAESENLALNKEVTEAVQSAHTAMANYSAKLTDGDANEKNLYEEGNWFSFYYNAGNEGKEGLNNTVHTSNGNIGSALIDLGETCTLDKVRVHTTSVYLPDSMSVEVSNDGSSYKTVGSWSKSGSEDGFLWAEINVEGTVARYVRLKVQFEGMFAFVNEIEVLGAKGGEPSDEPEQSEEAPAESEEAPAESEEAPAESEEAPAESEEAPAESEEAPAESEEASAESEEAPANEDEANLTWLWIVIAVVIVAAVVVIIVASTGKKKSK